MSRVAMLLSNPMVFAYSDAASKMACLGSPLSPFIARSSESPQRLSACPIEVLGASIGER